MTIVQKLKNLDNYRWAGLITLCISGLLLLPALIALGDFSLANWLLDLIVLPSFLGAPLSGATYIARWIDAIKLQEDKQNESQVAVADSLKSKSYFVKTLFNWRHVPYDRPVAQAETRGTFLGILAGIGVTAVLCAFSLATMPFGGSTFLSIIADVVFGIGNVSVFAGLGNRIGSALSQSSTRPKLEKWGVAIGVTVGLTVGYTVAAKVGLSSLAPVLAKVGIAAVLTGGTLGVGLFGVCFASTMASAADYVTKGVTFILGYFPKSHPKAAARIAKHYHEYRGALIGVGLGIAVACCLIPHVLIGILSIMTIATVLTTCVSVLGGLCSRIGRLYDGFVEKRKQKALEQQNFVAPNPQPAPLPRVSPGLTKLGPRVVPVPTPRPAPAIEGKAANDQAAGRRVQMGTKLTPAQIMQIRAQQNSAQPPSEEINTDVNYSNIYNQVVFARG